jgi:DNA repair exonuclease SbcCD ATPase subunit
MALANYRIMSLAVEGFRGFTRPQSISFDGRNVFIFGENGLGKSSIVEAIQWCLFGGTDIQVRNSVYEKQECRVVLDLAGDRGKLTIRRELRPGRTESDLRIDDARGKEVTLREVFPQIAKLRSSERTQVIFAAQHAAGRRTRADITEFGPVLYYYLKLEEVPDLIEQISNLIEEQRSESETSAERIEVIEDKYRTQRKQLQQLIENIRTNPPWQDGPSPTETETDSRIEDFVKELSSLLGQPLPISLSSDNLLARADEWLNLQVRDAATFQSKLRERSQQIQQLEARIQQARGAEALITSTQQTHRELQERLKSTLASTTRKAIIREIARRESAQTKTAAIFDTAESVAKLCEKYELETCPACGSNLDHESLIEYVNQQLEGRTTFDSRGEKLEELREKLRALDETVVAEQKAAAEVAKAQSEFDATIGNIAQLAGRGAKNTTLAELESYVAKLRSDLALDRSKTDTSETNTKALVRRVSEYKQERQYHIYRQQISNLDKKLNEGMEEAHKRLRNQQDFLHRVNELKQLIETAFKNALDRAIPPLNERLSTVYQRMTHQRSFELVRVYHDPEKIGHLELRVAQKRRPDKNYPPNVLNGQAFKALHLVPYFVFSRLEPEVLELDLLLIDDPSESFDTSHVALLIEELHIASEHAQLIVASHEQEKFLPHLNDNFEDDEYMLMVVSDFDPVSGPKIDRYHAGH